MPHESIMLFHVRCETQLVTQIRCFLSVLFRKKTYFTSTLQFHSRSCGDDRKPSAVIASLHANIPSILRDVSRSGKKHIAVQNNGTKVYLSEERHLRSKYFILRMIWSRKSRLVKTPARIVIVHRSLGMSLRHHVTMAGNNDTQTSTMSGSEGGFQVNVSRQPRLVKTVQYYRLESPVEMWSVINKKPGNPGIEVSRSPFAPL